MVANLLGEKSEEQALSEITHISVPRFDARAAPAAGSAEAHGQWLKLWEQVAIGELHGFPLWEKEVHDLLRDNLDVLASIFNAYAASSIVGASNSMDVDELHDFVIETSLEVDSYGWSTMMRQYQLANRGSSDEVLDLHEFLTFLVRVSFYRANPRYGLRRGAASKAATTGSNLALTSGHASLKGQGKRGASAAALAAAASGSVERALTPGSGTTKERDADADAIETPLPGCLFDMLNSCVLPDARRDGDAEMFRTEVLPSAEVVSALSECATDLHDWYERVSEGADYLALEQWLRAIDRKQLLTDLTIRGHRVRLTEPQARAAFFAAAAEPMRGLLPDEFAGCVAQAACDKYRNIQLLTNGMRFTNGDKVRAFVQNLMGLADEEDVLLDATPAKGAAAVAAAAPTATASSPTRERPGPPPKTASSASTAAADAMLTALNSPGFLDRLAGGGGARDAFHIGDLMDALGAAVGVPALQEALQQQPGIRLFSALDVTGDGTIGRDGLSEAVTRAVLAQPELVRCFAGAVAHIS